MDYTGDARVPFLVFGCAQIVGSLLEFLSASLKKKKV